MGWKNPEPREPGAPYKARKRRAVGFPGRAGKRRIVVEFDQETFDQVQAKAATDNVSFGEAVRQLVEWGLEV